MIAAAFHKPKDNRVEHDLLCREVQVLYSAEKLIFSGLTRMIRKAYNPELKTTFQEHLEETGLHIERLERIAQILNINPEGDYDSSVNSLIVDNGNVAHKAPIPENLDASLMEEAQKIEQYEISGYGTAGYYALELGLIEVAVLLHETLKEERAIEIKLSNLAKKTSCGIDRG